MITAKSLLLKLLVLNPINIDVDAIDVEQAFCLAINVYHESRGESVPGQIAVAQTTLNRVFHPKYPNTICGVVKDATAYRFGNPNLPEIHQCSFSWFCDGKPDTVYIYTDGKFNRVNAEAFIHAASISLLAMSGKLPDNTKGATHYYNHHLVSPYWSNYYPVTNVIGQHTFLKREEDSLQ